MKSITEQLDDIISITEKSIVNQSDRNRMINLVKQFKQVIYKNKLFKISTISPTKKFIKVVNGEDIEIDKIKSYEIDQTKKAIVITT